MGRPELHGDRFCLAESKLCPQLKRGQAVAGDMHLIRSIDLPPVQATKKHLSKLVTDIVDIQLLFACRLAGSVPIDAWNDRPNQTNLRDYPCRGPMLPILFSIITKRIPFAKQTESSFSALFFPVTAARFESAVRTFAGSRIG